MFNLQLQFMKKKEDRLKYRDHYGDHVECQYTLMSYGISPSTLICDQNGNLKSNIISQFCL